MLYLDHNRISEIHPLQFQNLGSLVELYLDHNRIYEIHPLQFQNLTSLVVLNLDHNRISEIHPLQFRNLTRLFQICFGHNKISEIHPLQFQTLTSLVVLCFDHNMISKIYPLQFQNLTNLNMLRFDHNNFGVIHPYQFQDNTNKFLNIYFDHDNISVIPAHVFPERGILYFLHNRISEIHPQTQGLDLSQDSFTVYGLGLGYNRISEIHPLLFQNYTNLHFLYIDHNDINNLHPNQFQPLQRILVILDLSHNNLVTFTLASTTEFSLLKYLSLANNRLRVLSCSMFQHILSIETLDLSNNQINMINSMNQVNSSVAPAEVQIDLRKNNLYSLSIESFSGFNRSTVVMVDKEATCCFITTVNCSATFPKSQFLTCGKLLPNHIQRVTLWILGLFALLSNLGVLLYRFCNKQNENKVQLLLISNLSISDLIMGLYMIIISSADLYQLYYKRIFPSELWWRSFACKFAETLSVLSSEASVFFVTLISVDRLIGITCRFSTYRIGTRTSRVLSLVLWLIAISISILSTILSSIDPDWYDVSEVCTGLPLSQRDVYETRFSESHGMTLTEILEGPGFNTTFDVVIGHQPGMYLGLAVFTALNSICFVVICACYTGIFLYTVQTTKQAGRGRDMKQERKMATKMGAIVITDLLCWAPIIILSILVQSGRHVVTPRVYTWIVTFVLPINSAINPFLYTLSDLIFDFMNKKGLSTSCPQNVKK